MSFQRILLTVLFGALPLGCAGASIDSTDDGDDLGHAAQAMEQDRPIISTNGLAPGLMVQGTVPSDLAALAGGAISSRTALADTDDGRKVLGYLARCALADGSSFTSVDSNGVEHSFSGNIGLAPGWLSQGLDAAGRGWVSACMLAHANAYGQAVTIALRGDHPALSDPPPDDFVAQEAAFYGDIFAVQQGMSSCIGYSASSGATAPPRVCGRTSECGFRVEGECAEEEPIRLCGGGPDTFSVCTSMTTSGYVQHHEVITVFTQPGAFGLEHSCSHAPDVRGWPLGKSCSSLITAVCTDDPYCCETDWDDTCVAAAKQRAIGMF